MRPTARKVAMTPAQQHAQDETRRVLKVYVDQAEQWIKKIDTTEGLCPCGIALRACLCPLRRDAAGARLSSTLAV